MRIDAHQHYWLLARGDYEWLTPETGVLFRDYLPEHLAPSLRKYRIDGTILIQAAPTLTETEYLLELCGDNSSIAGVVGWLNLEDDDFGEQLNRLRRHPRFVGFRPMSLYYDVAYLERPKLRKAFELLAEIQFPIDILVHEQQLEAVISLLAMHPRLRAVLNHMGAPPVTEGRWEPWAGYIHRLSQYPNLFCKLSGIGIGAGERIGSSDDVKSYLHHCIECFGTNRVMFGSDWPVCLQDAEYSHVIRIAESAAGGRYSESDKLRMFGINAAVFYKLVKQW